MKLALFSQNQTQQHIDKLSTYFSKPLEEVKFLYINTAGNYKPYKSDWMIVGEKRWQKVFPEFREFDLERAFRVNPDFDFEKHFSSFDFIFVSGGNTFVLSYWMNKTGTDKILKKLIMADKVVYGGESAGSVYAAKDISWAELADDPKKAPERINEGLGLIDFAILPHWQNPEFQPYLDLIKSELDSHNIQNYTITDEQGIFVENEKVEII